MGTPRPHFHRGKWVSPSANGDPLLDSLDRLCVYAPLASARATTSTVGLRSADFDLLNFTCQLLSKCSIKRAVQQSNEALFNKRNYEQHGQLSITSTITTARRSSGIMTSTTARRSIIRTTRRNSICSGAMKH